MNSTAQLDFHPDAESLNAFAEKALPERERGPIVAHLAECSRCRQVIFLARQAASEMETAAVPAARAAGRSGSWLSGWRLAWIPAAALATVVGLVFLVHGRHEETGAEMARAVPQTVPHAEESVANPAPKERVFAGKRQAPSIPVVEKPRESKLEYVPMAGISRSSSAADVPPPAAANEAVTVAANPPNAELRLTATPAGPIGQGIGMEQYKLEPLPGAPKTQSVGAMYSRNATADYAPKAKMDEMSERSQASRKAGARYGGSGGASTSRLQMKSVPHSSFDAGAQMTAAQFEAAHGLNLAPLPSGLAMVSSVTALHRELAIDQAGALFLSNDSGSHWESVSKQWTGRAVDVTSLQFMNGGTAAAATSGGAAAAPAPAADVFELRNDKNLTWVSRDGKTWTAQ